MALRLEPRESVSATWKGSCKCWSILYDNSHSKGAVNLADVTNLRLLTLRIAFEAISYPWEVLFRTVCTITSPLILGFILEVERVPRTLEPAHDTRMWSETRTELDEMFEKIVTKGGLWLRLGPRRWI